MSENKVKEKEKEKEKGQQELQKKSEQLSMSERFTNAVMREMGSFGTIQLTDYQRRLIQGYFIGVDRMLKDAEEERIRKNARNTDHKWDNPLPFIWKNVNMLDLALEAVCNCRLGLDMSQSNFLFPVPYRNTKTERYDVSLTKGYNGIRHIAEKYAVEKPLMVAIELVYETDTFEPIKKSKDNKTENYIFKINKPFERGKIVGGFIYYEYIESTKNRLIFLTIQEIEKRKPERAAPEFWGGTKKGYKGQPDEKIEGWYAQMVEKTLIREAYSEKNIKIDPEKVDDAYQYLKLREARNAENLAQAEIDAKANREVIDIDPGKNGIDPQEPVPGSEKKEDKDIPFAPEKEDAAETGKDGEGKPKF